MTTRLTNRQYELLKKAIDNNGVYPYTKGDVIVIENLEAKGFLIYVPNGSGKLFPTKKGREAMT